jgi:hypothetical protein
MHECVFPGLNFTLTQSEGGLSDDHGGLLFFQKHIETSSMYLCEIQPTSENLNNMKTLPSCSLWRHDVTLPFSLQSPGPLLLLGAMLP